MDINANFDFEDIEKAFEELDQEVDARLRKAGDMALDYAVNKTDYQNRTHNLRSANGYIITDNGEIKEQKIHNTYGKIEAQQKTQELFDEVDKSGRSLILANGMDYGSFVEAKGFDVLTGAALNANRELNK